MMTHSITVTTVMALVFFVGPAPSASDPMQRSASNAGNDFVTSLQKQMNPGNEDYGQKLQAGSALLLQETLGNAYFWVTATSLSGSFVSLWFMMYLIQQRQRREIISAKLLAWYHNELLCLRQSARPLSPIASATDVVRDEPSPEVLAELNRLRQLVTSQEGTEKVLRSQINSLTKKLGEEKQKNKSLKVE